MELIEISDGLFIQPGKVIAVKAHGEDAESCTVFMSGQSAVDGGFLIDRDFDEVVEDIQDALEGED